MVVEAAVSVVISSAVVALMSGDGFLPKDHGSLTALSNNLSTKQPLNRSEAGQSNLINL